MASEFIKQQTAHPYQQDPVPQADGYSEEGAPWKEVEVQGKKFPLMTFPKDLADAVANIPQADGYSEEGAPWKKVRKVYKNMKESVRGEK